ncbi:MAG: hypothetical protein NC206_08610 [Bacteroides sp.]|nr:hypothetical protein [Roseburia sp.]MCM1347131.1 hypothetical protein [Bacteroides sp.]MCM1421632.1 hypothetical protein [Bacteroides sp.]
MTLTLILARQYLANAIQAKHPAQTNEARDFDMSNTVTKNIIYITVTNGTRCSPACSVDKENLFVECIAKGSNVHRNKDIPDGLSNVPCAPTSGMPPEHTVSAATNSISTMLAKNAALQKLSAIDSVVRQKPARLFLKQTTIIQKRNAIPPRNHLGIIRLSENPVTDGMQQQNSRRNAHVSSAIVHIICWVMCILYNSMFIRPRQRWRINTVHNIHAPQVVTSARSQAMFSATF